MEWKRIYSLIPVPVFYNERVPKRFAGVSYGVLVIIRPAYKDDEGLLAHELHHCKQWWRTLGIYGILNHFSKRWRFKYEVEAYAVQLRYVTPGQETYYLNMYAGFIADKYGLDVTKEEARYALIDRRYRTL